MGAMPALISKFQKDKVLTCADNGQSMHHYSAYRDCNWNYKPGVRGAAGPGVPWGGF
jgi:hypothetical protein